MRTNIKSLCFALFLSGTIFSWAQQKTITGQVTDSDGFPVADAYVYVEGNENGVYTDQDGKYTISANKGDVVGIEFLGMETQTLTVGNANSYNVAMVSGGQIGLDDLVVAGVAGATDKKKLTITVDQISADQLKDVPPTSAASAMQGKVAGVTVYQPQGNPGSDVSIQLRGVTNIGSSQDPLIIVDGVQIAGSLADINVDNIKSYEVLKGAAASSIYGSRAGNGVVVITTKDGSGVKKGTNEVFVRTEFGISEIADYLDLNEHHPYVLSSTQPSNYTAYEGVTYPTDYAGGWNAGIAGDRVLADDHYADNPYTVNNNLQKDFFKKGVQMTQFVSFSNNGEKGNFNLSFENYKNSGIIKDTEGYSRQNFSFGGKFDLNDRLELSTNNLFIQTNNNSPGGESSFNGGIFFNLALLEPDVDLYQTNFDGQPYYLRPNQWSNQVNPLYSLHKLQRDETKDRFLGSYKLKYNILKGLDFEALYGFEKYQNGYTSYTPYDYLNIASNDNGSQYSEGGLYKYDSRVFTQNTNLKLLYDRTFGDLNVKAQLAAIQEQYQWDWSSISGSAFKFPGIISFDNFDSDNIEASSESEEINAINYFGIVGLDYKDRYLVDFLYRRDGSSLFGSNERWQDYFRISGAYRVTKDIEIPGVSELKLRAAYGTSGQRPGEFSAQYSVMPLSGGALNDATSTSGNPDLKPSLSTELELGLDASFLRRFDLSVVYSETTTEDQIVRVPLFAPAGRAYQWRNVGVMDSKSFEASLNSKIIDNDNLRWNLGVNFSTYNGKITSLDIPAYQTGPNGQDADQIFYIKEGESFGAMYGSDWVRSLSQMEDQLGAGESINDYVVNSDGYVVAAGTEGTVDEAPIKLLDENGDALYKKIGDAIPDFQMNFNTTVSYKGFSLYALVSWKKGGDVYNRTSQWLTRDGRNAIIDQSGKAEGLKKTVEYYQSFYDVNNINSYWVEDASFVKLREVSLYYDMPKTIVEQIGFLKEVRLGLIGRNLLTISDYTGYDPEVATYGSGNSQSQYYAVDFGTYPQFRNYSLSLSFKF